MLIAPDFYDRTGLSVRPLSRLGYPLLIEPARAPAALPAAIRLHGARLRTRLRTHLLTHGALLLRGFEDTASLHDCERIVDALGGEAMSYVGGTTTRKRLTGRIGTASGSSYRGPISVHKEMAYQARFPSHLAFFALEPARRGGETLLAGTRPFRERLPAEVWNTFARRDVLTHRRLIPLGARQGTWQGRPWNEALLTESREAAEQTMREAGWAFDWLPNGGLDIRQPALPAMRPHPDTGDLV